MGYVHGGINPIPRGIRPIDINFSGFNPMQISLFICTISLLKYSYEGDRVSYLCIRTKQKGSTESPKMDLTEQAGETAKLEIGF